MTGRRRWAWAVLLVAFAGTTAPVVARATPFAGTYRGVDVVVSLRGADGAIWNLEVVATQSVASTPAEQALYVNLERCRRGHCVTVEHSRRALPAGAVTVSPDMTSASILTRLGQATLRLSATTEYVDPGGPTVSHPGADVYSLNGPSARLDENMNADGRLTLGPRLHCPVVAEIFTFEGVDTVGQDTRDPRHGPVYLPRGVLHGRHRPSCAG